MNLWMAKDGLLRGLAPRVTAAALSLSLALVGWGALAHAGQEALPFGQGVLWKVEKGSSESSFVFGTIHVADQRVIDLPAPVQDAFALSKSATFELIVEPEVRMRMSQASLLTDGRRLSQVIGQPLFDKAAATARDYGVPGEALQFLKPWALLPIFTYPPQQFALISAGNAPLDEMLQARAAAEGKKVLALESAEEQLGLFNDMPEDQQVSMLASLLRDVSATRRQFEDMIVNYLAQDIDAIHSYMVDQAALEEDQETADAFQENFVVERNHRMATRMLPILDEGRAFVAIGALHLPGEDGVLALLENQGYKITRVY